MDETQTKHDPLPSAEELVAQQARTLAKQAAFTALLNAADAEGAWRASQVAQLLQDRIRIRDREDGGPYAEFCASDGTPILDENGEPTNDAAEVVKGYLGDPSNWNLLRADEAARRRREEEQLQQALGDGNITLADLAGVPKARRAELIASLTPEQRAAVLESADADTRGDFL